MKRAYAYPIVYLRRWSECSARGQISEVARGVRLSMSRILSVLDARPYDRARFREEPDEEEDEEEEKKKDEGDTEEGDDDDENSGYSV